MACWLRLAILFVYLNFAKKIDPKCSHHTHTHTPPHTHPHTQMVTMGGSGCVNELKYGRSFHSVY